MDCIRLDIGQLGINELAISLKTILGLSLLIILKKIHSIFLMNPQKNLIQFKFLKKIKTSIIIPMFSSISQQCI